jgi:hypothetical protein
MEANHVILFLLLYDFVSLPLILPSSLGSLLVNAVRRVVPYVKTVQYVDRFAVSPLHRLAGSVIAISQV